MRNPLTPGRSPLRLGAVALGAVALAGATLSSVPSTASGPTSYDDSAPALFAPAPASASASARVAAPAETAGRSRLVVVDPSALPAAAGRRVGLPLTGGDATARVDTVDHEPAFTAWSGTLEGQSMSSFTLVRVGEVYRGSVVSPDGVHTLTHAEGDRYWLTEAAPRPMSAGDDAVGFEGDATSAAPAEGHSRRTAQERRGRTKIGVMFGYTEAAKVAAGGKSGIKSAAALVITQTNVAFENSGLKVEVRLKGVVKTKGRESAEAVKNAVRVSRPRDGHYDRLQRVRRRHGADIIHLFSSGDPFALCGAGMMPLTPRQANPALGASNSFIECLPYLVATHELGHNLGADHIYYPGIEHMSQVPYSYGFFNVAGNYISVMSYYAPCEEAGIYTCVRVPYFSSPEHTYDGQPLAFDKYNDNAKVIRNVAPRVARYVR